MDAEQIDEGRARWQASYDRRRKSEREYTTLSGTQVEPLYGPTGADERFERIGWPGEYPFTRGIHATGYRGKPWTIRQFAGFGNAGRPTSGTRRSSPRAAAGCRSRSTCRR